MNVFFVMDDGSMITPPLTGTILPGITRDSLLTLARDRGLAVREERYSIDQWQADARSGKLREAFACGTAAVVTPIGRVRGRDGLDFTIGNGGPGIQTEQLRAALTDAYADEPFVTVLPDGQWPHTAATFGSNACQLQVTADVDAGRAVVVAAIDNLGKGAAGQAVQNANLALGFDETAGLSANGVAP